MPATASSRRFEIGHSTIEIAASSAGDVLDALARDEKFPKRRIDLAGLSLETGENHDLELDGGKGKVALAASGSARMKVGIFDKGQEVMDLLALQDGQTAGIELADEPGTRLALFLASYEVQAQVSGSHPIGVVGSVTFGVTGARGRLFAVVHRFPEDRAAGRVLTGLFGSVHLPRQVGSASDLAPGTLLVSEVEGSLAVKVGASLGYDFNFVREARALGLAGDIGLKLEAGVKATLGFEVSGRYLAALERPSLDEDGTLLRLRLFKLSHKGWSFGLNLSAKAQTVVALPEKADDLVKAVFGLHGQQVIRDLQAVESKWLSKDTDLSDTVAALAKKTGLDLLADATGITAAASEAAFKKARGVLMSAIAQWERLPAPVSSLLWRLLGDGGLTGERRRQFEAALKVLAANDPTARKALVTSLGSRVGIEDEAVGQLLDAVADRGLAELIDRVDDLRPIAQTILDVLGGKVIEKLQTFITEHLNIEDVIKAVKEADFKKLDPWLVRRISLFLDKKLGFEQLEEVKSAIRMVLAKRQEIYAKARQALNRHYDFDLAVKYESATTRTALLDIEFDTSSTAARVMLEAVVARSDFDRVLIEQADGVRLHQGVLTHAIERKGSIQVNMPFYSFESSSLTKSLAKVTANEEGGRVLFYEIDSSDTRAVKNRLTSQLSISAALPVALGPAVRTHGLQQASWAYQLRTIGLDVRRAEFENRITPLLSKYFGDRFTRGGESSISTFITDLDRAVEARVGNGTDEFGDVLAALDLSLPARVIASWFEPRDRAGVRQAARAVSLRVQSSLRRLLPYFYFQDLDHLRQNSDGSPMLVWSALPAANQFQISGGTMIQDKGVIWDVFDPDKRRFLVDRPETIAKLGGILADSKALLEAAGRTSQASFFEPTEIGDFLGDPHVRSSENTGNFVSLLALESRISRAVESALDEVRKFHEEAEKRPSKAIAALAEAGEDLVQAFHGTLSSVYGSHATRVLGSMLFVEGACALDPALAASRPTAFLGLTILKETRTFRVEDFLANKLPRPEEVALEQRLVAAGAVA